VDVKTGENSFFLKGFYKEEKEGKEGKEVEDILLRTD